MNDEGKKMQNQTLELIPLSLNLEAASMLNHYTNLNILNLN